MAERKKTPKRKFMAYILYTDGEFGYSMTKIANFLDVSQSTITNWIKEAKYEIAIKQLEKELDETRSYLRSIGLNAVSELPDSKIDVLEVRFLE